MGLPATCNDSQTKTAVMYLADVTPPNRRVTALSWCTALYRGRLRSITSLAISSCEVFSSRDSANVVNHAIDTRADASPNVKMEAVSTPY